MFITAKNLSETVVTRRSIASPIRGKKKGGRPTIDAEAQRTKRVSVPFTKSEYEVLARMAGFLPDGPEGAVEDSQARRRAGSMAGYIRDISLNARQPITPEQVTLLGKLIDQFNELDELARRSESVGLLALKNSFVALQQRINQVLDKMDQAFKQQK